MRKITISELLKDGVPAELLQSPLTNHRQVARDAGWDVAEGDVPGVLKRLASAEEKERNLGQERVYAHSWEQACEIDGLDPTIASELEFFVVDGTSALNPADKTCLVPDYASAARAEGWEIERDYVNYAQVEGDLSIRHVDQGFSDSSYAANRDGWRTCCEENEIAPLMVAIPGRVVANSDGTTILVRPLVDDLVASATPHP